MANKTQDSGSKVPVAAAQPPKGGIEPGIAPIDVLSHVIFLSGV